MASCHSAVASARKIRSVDREMRALGGDQGGSIRIPAAGPDGLDPREYGAAAKPYREALGKGAGGLKIAIFEEGFGHSQSMPQVDGVVREADDVES